MKGLHRTQIDYCRLSGELIGREGYVLNIITGCKHGCPWCYARRLVEHGRLKESPSYPYGFEPTFHPDRIRKIGGKPKLIFLNDMGDVGGDWMWKSTKGDYPYFAPGNIAKLILHFANLNPQHILLLLTKNPAWYALAEWPDNVIKGFSASNNKELEKRWGEYNEIDWVSLEPWLDENLPGTHFFRYLKWAVIGGLSGKKSQSVSNQTKLFLGERQIGYEHLCPVFVKDNAQWEGELRMYPDSWKVTG